MNNHTPIQKNGLKGRFSRTVSGQKPEFQNLMRPFSNFEYIEKRFSGIPTLRRIMSQVRQHEGQTMVIEKINKSEDILQENEDIKIVHPAFEKSEIYRLSFFKKHFSTSRGLRNVDQKDFLGYVIIKEDDIPGKDVLCRIYESVIKHSRLENNFIKGEKEWYCSIGGNDFTVKGYIYAQQNNITNVCAHVALRTAVSCFYKDCDMTYREMNKIIGIDHISRRLGDGNGLVSDEMVQILEAAGAKCVQIDYTQFRENQPPFQKFLYSSVESGFPAIAIFEMSDNPMMHAVPVFGHTFNEDTWVYRAESLYFKVGEKTAYIPSESWVSMYIGHDDNWGSNFCIPRGYLHTRRGCLFQPEGNTICSVNKGCLCYIIGTLPKGVQMNAVEAEVIGAGYLFTILPQLPDLDEPWAKRLIQYALNKQLILRPILIKSNDYSEHLKKISDWSDNKLGFTLKVGNEEWFWMVELSIPELFSANRRKVAEVILRAEIKPKPERDFKNFIISRVPGYFAIYRKSEPDNPKYIFLRSNIKSHVELYGCEES